MNQGNPRVTLIPVGGPDLCRGVPGFVAIRIESQAEPAQHGRCHAAELLITQIMGVSQDSLQGQRLL
eukprot:5525282-Heterocapsa_arctica.AAC.1